MNITKLEFLQIVKKHPKNNWLNGRYIVDNKPIGIKSYNNWVQIFERNCISSLDNSVYPVREGSPEFKTKKALLVWLESKLDGAV